MELVGCDPLYKVRHPDIVAAVIEKVERKTQ